MKKIIISILFPSFLFAGSCSSISIPFYSALNDAKNIDDIAFNSKYSKTTVCIDNVVIDNIRKYTDNIIEITAHRDFEDSLYKGKNITYYRHLRFDYKTNIAYYPIYSKLNRNSATLECLVQSLNHQMIIRFCEPVQ